MQNLVSIYEENRDLIDRFIISSLRKVGLMQMNDHIKARLFSIFPNLELLYESDEGFVQVSPNYTRSGDDPSHIGIDRSYLIDERALQKGYYVHDPYISTTTGHLCITVVYQTGRGYVLLDFRLRGLLERFDLIEKNSLFKYGSRYAYALIGSGLLFFGIFVVLYGFYTFAGYFFGSAPLSLDAVFKPVIALTLGLAVFDLGKTIVEQEVVPKTEKRKETFNAKTLMNFSVSIIIALLIEALLVVFKISISDYRDLPYAAWLIAALSLLMFVFAVFVYLVRKSDREMHTPDISG
jgi:uncharacterized Tic20 family protein